VSHAPALPFTRRRGHRPARTSLRCSLGTFCALETNKKHVPRSTRLPEAIGMLLS
jgi:hypothetical protein